MTETSLARTKVAIIGSGNIGSDLMFKVLRLAPSLEMSVLVGIDPRSDGLQCAGRLGVATTSDGVAGLIAMPDFGEIEIIFDATSAKAHLANAAALEPYGKQLIDLTPAAVGPYVIPSVGQPRPTPQRTERQYGHLRRSSHHPGGGSHLPGHLSPVRRDRCLHRLEIRGTGHPGQHRRVHRDDCVRDRGRWRRRTRQSHHRPQSR